MVKEAITGRAEQFVRRLLTDKLTAGHRHHNLAHTLSVRDTCLDLGRRLDIKRDELEILELACLFHDTGFTEKYEDHEEVSSRIAEEYLKRQHYPQKKLKKVLDCIKITDLSLQPANTLEQLIRDADLNHLANNDYLHSLENLRHEWKVFLNQSYSDEEWDELNYEFLKGRQYFTSVARDLLGPQKDKNQQYLKKVVKKNKKIKIPEKQGIGGSKSAQMMFKTSLRNHLDLSALADNKANIMLSVNALIITIVVPVAASYLKDNIYILIPMISLLITCLGSMIYATLATRPIKMKGITGSEAIKEGRSNLFFFGNFYSMSYSDYQSGMQQVIADEKNLDDSIMRDLYFLGKSLGTKYKQLRICYTIFMIGIIVTVIIFGISYSLYIA